jgi:nucleoside-diphosphate-sugar epimerase
MRKVFDMILLTGGAGYIGSHVCIALLEAGLDVALSDCGTRWVRDRKWPPARSNHLRTHRIQPD